MIKFEINVVTYKYINSSMTFSHFTSLISTIKIQSNVDNLFEKFFVLFSDLTNCKKKSIRQNLFKEKMNNNFNHVFLW